MYKILLLILGWLAMGLACLGAVLPILPTTPFLLLAAWCFARSSPRFHHWLLYRSWFGSYLHHWQTYRGLPPGAKWKAIMIVLVTFSFSLWTISLWWVRALLMVILVVILAFMLRIPVIDPLQQNDK
ncbi:DUF454 family protein [Budvicia diplopodorum]|uniref:DUF454 family protein n=1 Tax=Budvicia diplopodorum TaxID=1119056 RepID=UPI00135ACF4D|nr:DUF454 family protein [Budvicia diplopodorum]